MTDPIETDLPERLTDLAQLAPDRLGVSLADIRRRGRGRQRARLGLSAAAATSVAAAVAVTGYMALPGAPLVAGGPGTLSSPGPDPVVSKSGAPQPVNPTAEPWPSSSAPDGPGGTYGPPAPIGDVIRTGLTYRAGTLELWVERPSFYGGKLMVAIGIRKADGTVERSGEALEFDGPDRTPGFHTGYRVGNLDGGPSYALVGYVVGDVAKVTMTVDGQPVTAQSRRWSEDPNLVIWWIVGQSTTGTPDVKVTDAKAYSAAGSVVASTGPTVPLSAG